jgi:hypothetical protein
MKRGQLGGKSAAMHAATMQMRAMDCNLYTFAMQAAALGLLCNQLMGVCLLCPSIA